MATSAIGSSVSSHATTVTAPDATAAQARAGRRLEARGDQRQLRAIGDRDDEHRQALERDGVVAREVAQVRPDADQERVEARDRRLPAGAREADGISLGGDLGDLDGVRAAHAMRSGVVAGPGIGASVSVGSGVRVAIQAPSTRSPCSNRAR